MKTKYSFQGLKENMAKAISKDLGISTKTSIEIANFLRGRNSSEAKTILDRVLKKKQPIPFKRFTDGVGHRKGVGLASGRFPVKASEAFLTIIKQCEANAQAKGLSSDLRIVHLSAQKGTNMFRHGRQRRRLYKRTHLEIVLEELDSEKDKVSKSKKPVEKNVVSKPEKVTPQKDVFVEKKEDASSKQEAKPVSVSESNTDGEKVMSDNKVPSKKKKITKKVSDSKKQDEDKK